MSSVYMMGIWLKASCSAFPAASTNDIFVIGFLWHCDEIGTRGER